jgi:hypothetical protein
VLRGWVAFVALSLALAGCGGSKSDSEQVTSVTHRYIGGLASGNGSEACSVLTGEAKQQLFRAGASLRLFGVKTGGTCESAIVFIHKLAGADQLALLGKAKVSVASLSGNTATARITAGSHVTDVPLSKTAAGWLITKLSVPSGVSSARAEGSTTGGATTEAPPREAPSREAPSSEGAVAYVHETFPEYESQLGSGAIREVTINKRLRTVRVTLNDGRHVLAQYAPHEEPHVVRELRERHVPVTILTRAQALPEGGG